MVAVLAAKCSGILLTMLPFPHCVQILSHHCETTSSQKQSKACFSALIAENARATFSAFHVTTFSEYLMNSWAAGMTMPLFLRTYAIPPAFLLPYLSPNCFFLSVLNPQTYSGEAKLNSTMHVTPDQFPVSFIYSGRDACCLLYYLLIFKHKEINHPYTLPVFSIFLAICMTKRLPSIIKPSRNSWIKTTSHDLSPCLFLSPAQSVFQKLFLSQIHTGPLLPLSTRNGQTSYLVIIRESNT